MCRQENLPSLSVRAIVVDRQGSLPTVARVQVLCRDGSWWTALTQEWPSGRPTPVQLRDIEAQLASELAQSVIGTRGVQGVL